MDPQIYLLIVLILMSGFFSGAEIALFSLNDAKLRSLIDQQRKNALVLQALKKSPQKLLITILIANNSVNIGASSLATVFAIEKFGSAGAGIATGVMTFLILFFGEIIPKSLAQGAPGRVALIIAPWMKFVMTILTPLVILMNVLTLGFQKLARVKQINLTVSEADVKAMVDLGLEDGSLKRDEKEMIDKVFLLNDIVAEDVMTPAEYFVGFDTETPLVEALPIIEDSGYSRFPVFNKGGDVEGIVYIKDVFRFLADKAIEAESQAAQAEGEREIILQTKVASLMVPALFVPETTHIDELLKQFQKQHKHISIVVDEHGSVRGLATLEDLLEEIVGEIIDESDVDENLIKRIDEHTIKVDTRVTIGRINNFFNTTLRGSRQKTIGWLVLKEFGRIPQKGDSVTINDYNFIVDEADDRRIKRLTMIKTARAKLQEFESLNEIIR